VLALSRIRFNIVSVLYVLQDLSVKRLALMFPYRLSVKDYSRCLSAVIGKDCFRATGFKSLGLLRGVRGLRGGACVRKFNNSIRARAYIISAKRVAYALIIGTSLPVLCQLADTSPVLPMSWACTPNTLHVAHSHTRTIGTYLPTLTYPHPLNFGARCYIHPTLTQTTFSSFKKHYPMGKSNNKDIT